MPRKRLLSQKRQAGSKGERERKKQADCARKTIGSKDGDQRRKGEELQKKKRSINHTVTEKEGDNEFPLEISASGLVGKSGRRRWYSIPYGIKRCQS